MKQTDLAELTNKNLYDQKIRFLNQVVACDEKYSGNKQSINYHGINLNIECSRIEITKLIKKIIPNTWFVKDYSSEGYNIKLISSKEFDLSGNEWEDEASPECILSCENGVEYAIQRDFAGAIDGENIIAIINDEIADGFYNVLRWFMPRKMILKGQTILHSSCVITNGEASFFLGHSGYGKSTLTEFAQERVILGDDMNILTINEGKYYAEGAALGGLYDNQSILGQKFPVKAFYWLHKAEIIKVVEMGKAEAARKLISSCANIFWGKEDKIIENKVMNLSTDIVNKYPFYNLYFSLDKGFWKYVEQ